MLNKGPYKPNENESEMLSFWLENKFYSPDYISELSDSTASREDRETFTIILPPPNANGNLHLGHMSGYAYQDLMGRYNRMKGKKVLLLPGKDHAGIQTEVVFERELEKRGLTKQEIGREKFYYKCFDFCMKNSEIARSQEQKIGLSADFDRELFTLDPRIVDEVLEAFRLMYEDGLIYRGKRLINWCVRCQSALADIDTEYKDAQNNFFYFKYGFTEPEKLAIELRDKFINKESISFFPCGGGESIDDYDFQAGEGIQSEIAYYTKGRDDAFSTNVPFVKPIGYNMKELKEILDDSFGKEVPNFEGIPIGVEMRLDGQFKLVVANPEKAADIDSLIADYYKETYKIGEEHKDDSSTTSAAGSHIVRFDQYQEDRFYTNGFILATVRPETKFGDTAIACHPDDPRYQDFIGKEFEVLTLNGPAKIKLIADKAVDMGTGTGVLKVTPAHALEDWDIAQRHPEDTMPEKQVINFDGKLNHLTGKYEGKTVAEARELMVEHMREIGMLVYLDTDYTNRIKICERCKSPIEPLISYQWFVDTKPLKAKAKQLVEDLSTDIMPDGMKSRYIQWMEAPEDWCITRQLWWGYRLPVWYQGERSQYITETGEVKEKIGDKIIESEVDYKDLLFVGPENPNPETKQLFLIPGKHGYGYNDFFPNIANSYSKTTTLEVENLSNPSYKDYEEVFKQQPFSKDSVIVSHSLGARAILRYLIKKKKKINTLILLAPATEPRDKDKEANYADLFNDDNLYSKLEKLVPNVHIIYSDNDELASVEMFEKFSELIPNSQQYLESDNGHYAAESYTNNSEKLFELLPKEQDPNKGSWNQDEDVLDTWFSSGQWPYVTLKANKNDYETFYPTQVMETGWDILIFWVTRMMLLNPYRATKDQGLDFLELKLNAEIDKSITPFENVYLHGLVQDKDGQKMSKSKGNGIDPFEMMQKYGTDALRFSFIVGNAAGQNYRLFDEKIASYRNFCNKIWNASKFTLMNLEDAETDLTSFSRTGETIKADSLEIKLEAEDIEMLDHMQQLIKDTTRRLDKFQFGIAAQELYDSFWHKLADEYIETAKQRLYTKDREGNPINTSEVSKQSRLAAQWTLFYSLESLLKMLHPFIPFITERIWQELPKHEHEAKTIMYSQWPST